MTRMLKAHRMQKEIVALRDELRRHQAKCRHLKATKENRGNTGNYDPSANSYWIEFSCPTCLRKWSRDQ